MQTVNIDIKPQEKVSYPIFITENACDCINDVFNNLPSHKAVLVTNYTIYGLYENKLQQMFSNLNCECFYCILEDGEQYKNKNSLEKILDIALKNKLERNDVFIAFGGGVVGDITGFAASVYLRGVNFVQIPTTILAQVDSSVGGKVAINTKYGKNLVGAFYQPKAVISDLTILNTLPQREILTGLSEVVKYSFIEKTCGDVFVNFADFLNSHSEEILNLRNDIIERMIEISCKLKAAVVKQDERENGLRAILNFGHTIGHSIEKCTNYNVFTHGEAVAIGMRAIFNIARKLNKIDRDYFDFANGLLDKFGLTFNIPNNIKPEDIYSSLIYDKKVKNGNVRFILPVGYAQVEIFDDIPEGVIKESIEELY